MIHTIGDSHSTYGFDQIEGIKCNFAGASLMYTVGFHGIDFNYYKIQPNDTTILCYGEIDCRCHIHKYKNNYKENITNIVNTYINMINKNSKEIKDIKIVIYNIPPPCRHKYIQQFPVLGTDEERKTYTVFMNRILKEACIDNGFRFFDVYDKYCDSDGMLNPKLSHQVHITNPMHIKEFINNNLK